MDKNLKKYHGMGLGKKDPTTKSPTKKGPNGTDSTKKQPTMEATKKRSWPRESG